MRQVMTMAAVAFVCGVASVLAAERPEFDQAAEEAAIRRAVRSYVSAFNRADIEALAAQWSPEGVYTNPITGEQVVGREAIADQFSAIFADSKGARLRAVTNSVQFVSPNVAIEKGTARVTRPDQEPEESEYTAVYVRRGGEWLLDRVTEEDAPPSQYPHLKELEWMIGTWIDQDEQSRVETTCEWTKNQNFIARSFTLSMGDRIEMAGLQIIGWDPATQRIRSWVFDSDGGFGEGVWSKHGNSWNIQATGTLPDGGRSSSTNVITYLDDNSFTWQSLNREADGELLPNVDEVVVVRQTAEGRPERTAARLGSRRAR